MKKILQIALGLFLVLVFAGCNVNEQFEGLETSARPTNVAKYNYKLVAADYTAISNAALKLAANAVDSAKARSINTNKFFTADVSAADYVPLLLKTKYPYGDLLTSANITYTFGEVRPTYLTDLTANNILQTADYSVAWGGGTFPNAFTPSVTPAAKLPSVLLAKFPAAVKDEYKLIEYNYSLTEPPVTATEKQWVVYKFSGTAWALAEAAFTPLQMADYTSMGLTFINSTNVPLYLPQFLSIKFPYALEGTEKILVYRSSSAPALAGVTHCKLTNKVWVPSTFIVEKTEQFVYSNAGWLFDPTIRMIMEKPDYKIMVDYVLATPAIAIFAHPFWKNEEFYYGFSSRYTNTSFRLSYRNPYFTGIYIQPATIDPELNNLTTVDEKVALMWTRLQEGMRIFLTLRFPNAVPDVSGVEVFYHAQTLIYYVNGVSSGNEKHKYIFKCTAAASGGNPPTFQFISKEKVN